MDFLDRAAAKKTNKLDFTPSKEEVQNIIWFYFYYKIEEHLESDREDLIRNYLTGVCLMLELLKSTYKDSSAILRLMLMNCKPLKDRIGISIIENNEISGILIGRS